MNDDELFARTLAWARAQASKPYEMIGFDGSSRGRFILGYLTEEGIRLKEPDPIEAILVELEEYGEVMIFDEEMDDLPIGIQVLTMMAAKRVGTVFLSYDPQRCATVITHEG